VSDNENIDLKARLGRKRLRTSSQKDLESNIPGQEQGYERPPTGEFRAASDDGMPAPMGLPSVPAPGGMPMAPGAPAPAAVPMNVDFTVGKSSKVTTIIIVLCCALPALGLGYCTGHRVEQNGLVNKATDDAKSLKASFDLINEDLRKFQAAFAAPPAKVSGWLAFPQDISLKDPDLSELAAFKLNYIPTPKQRKEFMGNLVSFYSVLFLIKAEHNNLMGHAMDLESFRGIIEGMEKAEEKQNTEEGKDAYLANVLQLLLKYKNKTVQGRGEAAMKETKGEQKFVMLWDGGTTKTVVVPLQAEALVCPEAKKDKCEEYDKVVSYMGMEFPFELPKDVKAAEVKVAIKFGEIAQRSMEVMVKTELLDPMVPRLKNTIESFFKLQGLLKDANEYYQKLNPVVDSASKRKKRSFL